MSSQATPQLVQERLRAVRDGGDFLSRLQDYYVASINARRSEARGRDGQSANDLDDAELDEIRRELEHFLDAAD
eukprot:CAMPEP_0183783774 /NCGR_PEP_ID=MMETSP0739-20130205/64390_1 /TAXON_ID=385413 /ORGANISM="Thalassiosira miniscula, Strain CCMP1093" /LENGTH=73 /DNA_ID=CAMNT_0026027545 /DNA_START=38 /DNA_END=259 /DNA_ORIENTATION=+